MENFQRDIGFQISHICNLFMIEHYLNCLLRFINHLNYINDIINIISIK
jgi:hypothetical protein